MFVIQHSRYYKKISTRYLEEMNQDVQSSEMGGEDEKLDEGIFDLVRDPMYQYSKMVKEKAFRDNFVSFLWLFYRTIQKSKSSFLINYHDSLTNLNIDPI